MINNLTANKGCSYEWIDITDPQEDELEKVAKQYGLHEASVADCLQPGHLPKYEQFKNYTFIILRVYFETNNNAVTVREITNKIAVFITDRFIITIHRKPFAFVEFISNELLNDEDCKLTQHVLIEILKAALHTYDEPGHKLTQSIEYYEAQVFLTARKVSMLKGLYIIKRKLDVIRRLLLLTNEIVEKMDPVATSNAYTRDARDLFIKQKSLYDAMSDNTTHLLNIYFNISAQRTNETMRVLTIFSVFFMPLTFIVGIYGMNFQYMPELRWKYGYPLSLVTMLAVIVVIYWWFRKKKWL
jgi:magnesium transporter